MSVYNNAWRVVYTKRAAQDAQKIKKSPLANKVSTLLASLARDFFSMPYEKLTGELAGAYSRRINKQHRLVYQVLADIHVIKVLRMWTHYGD